MPNVLEVQIVGDVSDLEKTLKKAEILQFDYTKAIEKTSSELKENITVTNGYKKAIDELNKEYKNGSVSSKDYSKQLANLKRDEKESTVATSDLRKELANLKREQKDLGGSIGRDLTPKVANGSNALIQMSRIAQDAPFGFSAIINNVTASGEALGYLVKQTGSVGGAFKALGSSLVGSGGVLLALSLVTTGIQFMIQNGITVGDVFNKITGNFDEANKSLQELNVEAVKGSQAQISTMNAYVATASNVNLSMSDRLIAVKKLQSEYPAYFGNLTQEQILNGKVGEAVKGVTAALIAKARAAALTDKIVKLAEEEEKVQNQINDAVASTFKFYKLSKQEAAAASVILNKQLSGEIDLVKQLETGNAQNLTKTEKVALAAFQYSATLRGLSVTQQKNISEQDKLTKTLEETTAAQIKLDTTTAKGAKAKKIDTTPKVSAIGLNASLTTVQDDKNVIAQGKKQLEAIADALGIESAKITPVKLNIPLQIVSGQSEFAEYAARLKQAKEETQIFADGAGASIGVLAGQFAKSFETGNAALDAFVGSLINSLAQIAQAQLTSLIAQQVVAAKEVSISAGVSTAKGIESASKTAAASGPAAAFVLPALVGAAIGFIAASFAGIKFAHGGVVPGGSFTGDKVPAMLNSGETVMNRQQQANVLMSIANGNSNTLQGNRTVDVLDVSTVLRGSDLLLAIERQKKKR